MHARTHAIKGSLSRICASTASTPSTHHPTACIAQFCNHCRANGLLIDASRVFLLPEESEEGFRRRASRGPPRKEECAWGGVWVTGDLGVTVGFSVFNDKARCTGLKILVFESALPPGSAEAAGLIVCAQDRVHAEFEWSSAACSAAACSAAGPEAVQGATPVLTPGPTPGLSQARGGAEPAAYKYTSVRLFVSYGTLTLHRSRKKYAPDAKGHAGGYKAAKAAQLARPLAVPRSHVPPSMLRQQFPNTQAIAHATATAAPYGQHVAHAHVAHGAGGAVHPTLTTALAVNGTMQAAPSPSVSHGFAPSSQLNAYVPVSYVVISGSASEHNAVYETAAAAGAPPPASYAPPPPGSYAMAAAAGAPPPGSYSLIAPFAMVTAPPEAHHLPYIHGVARGSAPPAGSYVCAHDAMNMSHGMWLPAAAAPPPPQSQPHGDLVERTAAAAKARAIAAEEAEAHRLHAEAAAARAHEVEPPGNALHTLMAAAHSKLVAAQGHEGAAAGELSGSGPTEKLRLGHSSTEALMSSVAAAAAPVPFATPT